MPSDARIEVSNEELISVREASRRMPELLRRLADGEIEKFVVTRRGKMVAVLISFAEAERLSDGFPGGFPSDRMVEAYLQADRPRY